jgi:Flp pilus assembly protein TadG
MRFRRNRVRNRRGSTAVEFALVAIPLFMFVFASIEFGRAMLGLQSMEESARAGCRAAVVEGATTEEVEAEVARILRASGIAKYNVAIEPTAFGAQQRWKPLSVTVAAGFNDLSWLPAPFFLGDMTFSASCTLPKESAPET